MTKWNKDPFKAWGRVRFLYRPSRGEPGLTPNLSPPALRARVQLSMDVSYKTGEEAIIVRTLDGGTTYGWLIEGHDWDQLRRFLHRGFRVVGGVSGVTEVKGGWIGDVIWWAGSKFKNAEEEQMWLDSMVDDE